MYSCNRVRQDFVKRKTEIPVPWKTELNMTVKYTECVTLGDHDENVEPQGKNVFGDIECCQESSILLFFYCCRNASVDVASCQSSLYVTRFNLFFK